MNITLKNGTTAQINRVRIEAQLTDSNGSEIGGLTTFTISETELSNLPLQSLYDSVYAVDSGEGTVDSEEPSEETIGDE